MASLMGDISVMPLADLLQWVDLSNKTGTIQVSNSGIDKKIYIETGKILFVSSNKEGERLGEFLHKGSHLELNKIKSALLQSQTMKVPFTQRLIDLNYFHKEELADVIVHHAKVILIDTLTWSDGSFLFIQDEIPSNILHGPIRLNTTELIYNVFKIIDDINLGFRKKKI